MSRADYKDLAKKLTRKIVENLNAVLTVDGFPDLYFKPEVAILKALEFAHAEGKAEAKREYLKMMSEFDATNGQSQN